MKKLNIKLGMIKIVILCLFTVGYNLNYGQTSIGKSRATVKIDVNIIDFQKKYIKQLKVQLKCNNELLRFIEKESRGITFQKKYGRELKAQLKRNKESLNKVKREIGKMEETLSGIGDDAQLANIDLQNMLQKQQQTLQTMSNVSKMLHDTAMAIIRKIG